MSKGCVNLGRGIGEPSGVCIQSAVINAGLRPPSFLPTKKKLEAAGDNDGRMNPCFSAFFTYFSMAFCSGTDNRYTLPLGIMAPGSSSMEQSHGLCGGSGTLLGEDVLERQVFRRYDTGLRDVGIIYVGRLDGYLSSRRRGYLYWG